MAEQETTGSRRPEQLTHLAGYAAIVAVLGAADWSTIIGSLVAVLFVVLVVLYFGYVGYSILTARVRKQAEAAAETKPVAADGGDG